MRGGRLTSSGPPLSKAQQWFRELSLNLESSFRSLNIIEHNVTKGEGRENQILDVLERLLPTRVILRSNVVIVDSEDRESPKFDGALFIKPSGPS